MKEHHLKLSKYWFDTAHSFASAGYFHMATLFTKYGQDHSDLAAAAS